FRLIIAHERLDYSQKKKGVSIAVHHFPSLELEKGRFPRARGLRDLHDRASRETRLKNSHREEFRGEKHCCSNNTAVSGIPTPVDHLREESAALFSRQKLKARTAGRLGRG
ncbi:unnamed protein product, partial [Ectocarpus sp. 13 AM-2016]